MCGCRLSPDDVAALGGFDASVNQRVYRWKARITSTRLCTGEALGCMPLMEILDLSWNSGVGGGALQGSPLQLDPSLRELHLVSCQLTAADAAVLGTDVFLLSPPTFPTIPTTGLCFPTCGDFTVMCLSLLGRIVSALPRLCVLDVSCNALLGQEGGGAGFGQLAASLSHTATLNTLRLQACGLTVDSLGDLGKFYVILDIFGPLLVRILPLELKVLAGFGFKWLDPRPLLCCRGCSSLPPGSERVGSVI